MKPITLVGLPGAGKSVIGDILARKLQLPFVDSDHEIERRFSMTVAEIFAAHGEAAFRVTEREVIASLLHRSSCVIALGGGALEDEATARDVQHHAVSIWLDPPLETIAVRLAGCVSRPLFGNENELGVLRTLKREREPAYARADHRIDGISKTEVVAAIIAALAANPRMRAKTQNLTRRGALTRRPAASS